MTEITILIVDDEEDLAELCCDAFESEGCRPLFALNGSDALEIYQKENIDAIISDAIMPGMGGKELLRQISELEKSKPLFYFATGSIEFSEENVIEAGATGLISKPFDLDEVVERVLSDIKQKRG